MSVDAANTIIGAFCASIHRHRIMLIHFFILSVTLISNLLLQGDIKGNAFQFHIGNTGCAIPAAGHNNAYYIHNNIHHRNPKSDYILETI